MLLKQFVESFVLLEDQSLELRLKGKTVSITRENINEIKNYYDYKISSFYMVELKKTMILVLK